MKLQIITKNYGTQNIDTNMFDENFVSKNSTIYKIVEHLFNEWYEYNTQDGSPMGSDYKGMYNGECDQPAIYIKSGAIRDGISVLISEAIELGKSVLTTKEIVKFDIESAFE
jgi:hypothetical protein